MQPKQVHVPSALPSTSAKVILLRSKSIIRLNVKKEDGRRLIMSRLAFKLVGEVGEGIDRAR